MHNCSKLSPRTSLDYTSSKYGLRLKPPQPSKLRARTHKCNAAVMDLMLADQENIPNEVASNSPIDVALQFSTQHRVYRAMLLMREPSGLLPAEMLPEQVNLI